MSYNCDICEMKFKSKKKYKTHVDYDRFHLFRMCLKEIDKIEDYLEKTIKLMTLEENMIKFFDEEMKNKTPEQKKMVKNQKMKSLKLKLKRWQM